ncbi:hypothetical protein OUZ56_026047 [Daphnia magna]|uniref:SWIM-type domain-containing protein n=1 Tax=Daphnia magna TaxID=35525 RepID=A0ABQ9ZL51_9CRUS|nr:hypothetical protein OUZ56_026047 [Daphnia magna]
MYAEIAVDVGHVGKDNAALGLATVKNHVTGLQPMAACAYMKFLGQTNRQIHKQIPPTNTPFAFIKVNSAPIGPSKKYVPISTVLSRAILIVLENRFSLAPLQHFFAVPTHGGQRHAVTLFSGENGEPHQTCTCASTVTCSHIMAATMSIGYVPRASNKRANGTTRRKNEKYSRSGVKGKQASGKTKNKQANGYKQFQRKNKKGKTHIEDDIFSCNFLAKETEIDRIESEHLKKHEKHENNKKKSRKAKTMTTVR